MMNFQVRHGNTEKQTSKRDDSERMGVHRKEREGIEAGGRKVRDLITQFARVKKDFGNFEGAINNKKLAKYNNNMYICL